MCFIGPAQLSVAMSFKLLSVEFDLKYAELIKELLEQGIYLKACNNLCYWLVCKAPGLFIMAPRYWLLP